MRISFIVLAILLIVSCSFNNGEFLDQHNETDVSIDRSIKHFEERDDGSVRVTDCIPQSCQNPVFSPDGEKIVFTRWVNGYNKGPADIVKVNLKSLKEEMLVKDAKIAADGAIYKVIKNIQQFDTSKSNNLKAWIYKIAKNCAIDILREKEKQFPFQSSEEHEETTGLQATKNLWQESDFPQSKQNLLATEILNKALHSLSPRNQKILTEKSYGLTHKEIGKQLDATEGAIKVAHHRALEKLKQQYINILDAMDNEEITSMLKSHLYGKPSEKTTN